MKTKAVLLVALANPKFNLRVNDEFRAIQRASRKAKAKEIVELVAPSLDTHVGDLFEAFREHEDCITVFHFSGHAHHHRLHLHDLKVNTQPINDFLAQQSKLKLVFLNGCNTAAQAKELVQRETLVIGTHTSIGDDLAVQFAESFYKNLLANHNVARSFREAQSEIEANQSQDSRGIVSVDRPEPHSANDWELFWKSKEALEWKLSDFKDDQIQAREIEVALRRMQDKSRTFDAYPDSFENVEGSHLPRQETQKLVQWIDRDLPQKPYGEPVPPIKILAGNAGYGKTVIMKEVLANLQKREIPVLALKADHLSYQDVDDLNQKLQLGNYFTDVFRILAKSHERVVVLIDQIDALSRSLSGNHSAIKAFQDFINELKSVGEGRIRIIVSCRIYDLEYDLLLQSLKVHDAVTVAALSKEQITQVLQKLDEGIAPQQLPENLWQLLKVPLHLDVFCRVYHPDLQLNSLAAVQDLYDELWEQKINQASERSKLAPQELSNLIEELAKQMYERQEISLNVRTFKRRHPDALAYLSTERLLIEEQKQLQFFHQSFFDYAFARWFVDAGLSIAQELRTQHQGLFLRSKVQQVLAFLRGDDAKEYIEELRTILADEEHVFRFHIQSMLINQLGFEEQPTCQEKQLVQDLILDNPSFFLVFLESVRGEQWTRFLLQEHFVVFEELVANRAQTDLSEAERAYGHQVVNQYGWFCRRQVNKEETQGLVLNFLKSLPEFDWRKDFVIDMFLQFSSFSDPVAFGLLEQYIDETEGWTFYETLKNTLPDHPEWVMGQLWKKFEANLSKIDKTQVNYGGVYFMKGAEATYFMKAFFKEAPDIAFQFAKTALIAIVDCEKTTEEGFYLTPSFWTQVPNDYEEDYRHTLDLLDHKAVGI
jgi:hypothetical protein